MLVGKAPFKSKDNKETYYRIKFEQLTIPTWAKMSSNVTDLVTKMLEKDTSKRLTLDELNEHPFVTKNGKIPGPLDEVYKNSHVNDDIKYGESEFDESEYKDKFDNSEKPYQITLPMSLNTNQNNLEIIQNNSSDKIPKIWVVKCVDYSSKYGMGYWLSNGHFGAFFNDWTKILQSPKQKEFTYFAFGVDDVETVQNYEVAKTPKGLKKKLRVLNNFREYLIDTYEEWDLRSKRFNPDIYVKSWLRSRHAFAFQFPNKVVQVLFNDSSEIRISGRPNQVVTYVDKEEEVHHYPLDVALEINDSDLSKRLIYAKYMIKALLT